MKKYAILALLLALSVNTVYAQSSSMTDDQVMRYVVKEHDKGTSNAQIVTKLMQQGVDISQIRRVRNKYERQIKQGGISGTSEEVPGKTYHVFVPIMAKHVKTIPLQVKKRKNIAITV